MRRPARPYSPFRFAISFLFFAILFALNMTLIVFGWLLWAVTP